MNWENFRHNACLAALVAAMAFTAIGAQAVTIPTNAVVDVRANLTVAGDPGDYLVAPGGGFDGVSRLTIAIPEIGVLGCSGSLLSSGRHVLTAAHCVTSGASVVTGTRVSTIFEIPSSTVTIDVTDIFVHDDWNGDLLYGGDLAILELAAAAPAGVERYDIYRGADEVGSIGEKVGYGRSGRGDFGQVLANGNKRAGWQSYDALADVFNDVFFTGIRAGMQLAFDFDSGEVANDAFGIFFGIDDTGLGPDEVSPAAGDSGGPTFIDGLIAGVTSYGFGFGSFPGTPDVTPGVTDSSFGEMGVDTRVSSFADWVDSYTGNATVPEPAPLLLAAVGLIGMFGCGRRERWLPAG